MKVEEDVIQEKRCKCSEFKIILIVGSLLLLVGIILLIVFLTINNNDSENDTNNNNLNNPPKIDKYIDLHLHLDGAITVDIAKQLASLQNINLPYNDTELERLLTVPDDCESLDKFLECFKLPLTLLQTKEGLTEAVRLVSDNIQSQGVIYAEIRFAPQLHIDKGMTQEEAVQAALDGLNKTTLKVNLILCYYRRENNEADNNETLRVAKKFLVQDGGVVAVDLAGPESIFPITNYTVLFEETKKYGIPFTIHAGEAAGAESVRNTIKLEPHRIGHGTRSNEDPDVVELIKNKNIPLEMCPTSNRLTHALTNFTKYPFMEYLHKGIKVTLNSDDMAIERITLAHEHEYMKKHFGLTYEEEKNILINSVNAAFTTPEVKAELRKKLGF